MTVQLRSQINKQLVLDEAIRQLLLKPEGEFRIADIYENTGLSSSVIYSYFRSRDGLINAAYIQLYKEMSHSAEKNLETIFTTAFKPGEVTAEFLKRAESAEITSKWAQNRAIRIRIAARAIITPAFMKLYAPLFNEHMERMMKQFKLLQEKNLISKKLGTEQLARMFEGILMAWALEEGVEGTKTARHWVAVISSLYTSGVQ